MSLQSDENQTRTGMKHGKRVKSGSERGMECEKRVVCRKTRGRRKLLPCLGTRAGKMALLLKKLGLLSRWYSTINCAAAPGGAYQSASLLHRRCSRGCSENAGTVGQGLQELKRAPNELIIQRYHDIAVRPLYSWSLDSESFRWGEVLGGRCRTSSEME